jgi:CRISPR-associated endonuclease/helicase Cas3
MSALPDRPRTLASAKVAGLLHDIGKYRDGFVGYLKKLPIPEAERFHKQAGAAWAAELGLDPVVTAIMGHHGGMPNEHEIEDALESASGRPALLKIRDRALLDCPQLAEASVAASGDIFDSMTEEILTRVLFSCLVDADWDDTSRHERTARGLPSAPALPVLLAETWLFNVLSFIAARAEATSDDSVAKARAEVLTSCLQAAEHPKGFYSLTVPTGGGKTLSGLAFAVAHAKANGLRRIIYVVPYLSILDQNAKVIRQALGLAENDPSVLEHHSLADPGKTFNVVNSGSACDDEETLKNDAARRAENWDAPVVITTNVMFLESLFSNQPRRCRKLHNIARSVIILDECQNIAPPFLKPTVAMLKQVVEVLGSTIVFATATQPAFDHPGLKESALTNVQEIIPENLDLFHRLKRVRMKWPAADEKTGWPSVAASMCSSKASLCVVNSRLAARELFAEIKGTDPDGAFHLSNSMCPAHRMAVLTEVRRRLENGLRCRLVSSQLIEAGVDVDFPLLFREMAPFDSIIQAAGRCNREGKLGPGGGTVTVFRSEEAALNPPRYFPRDLWYKAGRDVVEHSFLADNRKPEVDDPLAIREYFERVYRAGNLDNRNITSLRSFMMFRDVASEYRLIDDAGLAVVVATWEQHQSEIEEMIETFDGTRTAFRTLARFQVNLRCDPASPPSGVCEEAPGLFVWRGKYDPEMGWTGQDDDARWVV